MKAETLALVAAGGQGRADQLPPLRTKLAYFS